MQRFLIWTHLANTLSLDDAEFIHQISRVLRSAIGDEIILFDGIEPREYIYRITGISKRSVECERIAVRESLCEPARAMTLMQAMPNTLEKLEYVLQKCTELGASGFVIFRSDRSQKPLPSEAKRERLLKIVTEATEQCGGCILPSIEYRERLDEIMLEPKESYALDMGETTDFAAIQSQNITLLVGPEGGWSEDERAHFKAVWIHTVSFGNRVLRTETAGVAGCARFANMANLW